MKKILLYITSIFVWTVFSGHSQAQNIEEFLRPYADKIVEETSFEFSDKTTDQKFRTTTNLPIKQNL